MVLGSVRWSEFGKSLVRVSKKTAAQQVRAGTRLGSLCRFRRCRRGSLFFVGGYARWVTRGSFHAPMGPTRGLLTGLGYRSRAREPRIIFGGC